ncbi:MAG: Ldh family oxidoreductase [Gemmataceae bacterium]|nr:Ldh family oxidoreductase [Gemmataceae bacterium]MDW8267513.1 Ldh family oxidoreductase [Gemmataceae bacterium]
MPTFSASILSSFGRSLFEAGGVPPDEAGVVTTSLVDANLCGHDSHGLIRIPQYLQMIADGRLKPGAAFQVLRETSALVVADGGWGLGQVQAHRLLRRLVDKARHSGVAAGTLQRCGHIGRLGEYAEAAARHRLALIGTVNNHGYGRAVAPPGGVEGRIGTNPICLGVPTTTEPVFLDIGTSVCAEGKVRVCFNKKQPTPEGWLLDARGRPTTDPSVLYTEPRGTILPLGGPQAYKGFGLGLLLDMLVGGLSGAPCSHPHIAAPLGNAVLFIVLDIEQFAGAEHFLKEVGQLSDEVRTCRRAEGVREILLPGDPERRSRAQRQAGGIPLDDGTWQQLTDLAHRLKVPVPEAS